MSFSFRLRKGCRIVKFFETMASLPNHFPYDLSSGLKQSYKPQNLPDLINDLRNNNCGDEFKLFVLNSYLRKCQTELPVAGVLEQEHSQCRSMTLEGIDILKKEITRINKAIGLDISATSPMEFSAPNNYMRLKKQGVDLNNPVHGHEQRFGNLTHCHDKRQVAKLSTNQTSSIFYNPPPKAEKGPSDLNLQAKERTMMDVMLRPLTKPIWKNNRRAWTEELHARFLTVLQMLGGAEVATPKRIRDRMQVDGLTIDQVKSHLQKYRVISRSSHPEVAAKKPLKLKLQCGEIAETSGAGSSMNMGNLGG